MSITYTTEAGLGSPGLDDVDYVATLLATFARLNGVAAIGALAVREAQIPSTSRVVTISAGTVLAQDNTEVAVAATSKTMAANQTNYLYVDSAGAVQQNTTGFPASTLICRLAVVVAGTSTITSVLDARCPFRLHGETLSDYYLPLAGGTVTGLLGLSGAANAAGLLLAAAAPSAPADGQVWYDSARKALEAKVAGVLGRIPLTQFTASASATVANTTAETTLAPAGVGTLTLVANQLVVGKAARLRAAGYLSTTGSPTATVKAKLGGLVLSTGSISPGTGVANVAIRVEADFTCYTTGAGGTAIGQATCSINGTSYPMVATGTSAVDTTGTLAIDLTMTWGTAAAGNTVTVTNLHLELLN